MKKLGGKVKKVARKKKPVPKEVLKALEEVEGPKVKGFIEEYLSGIVIGIIVIVVVGYFGWRTISRKQRDKTEAIQTKQKISTLAERYNAVTNWQDRFDENGIKIGKGHRNVYTTDIESALI